MAHTFQVGMPTRPTPRRWGEPQATGAGLSSTCITHSWFHSCCMACERLQRAVHALCMMHGRAAQLNESASLKLQQKLKCAAAHTPAPAPPLAAVGHQVHGCRRIDAATPQLCTFHRSKHCAGAHGAVIWYAVLRHQTTKLRSGRGPRCCGALQMLRCHSGASQAVNRPTWVTTWVIKVRADSAEALPQWGNCAAVHM